MAAWSAPMMGDGDAQPRARSSRFLATIHAKEHLPGGAGAFRAADRPRRHRLVPLAGARNSRAPFPGKVVMAAELGILWALMFGVPASLLGEIRRRGPVHRP